MNTQNLLQQWGIEEAATQMGWQNTSNGFRYPLYNLDGTVQKYKSNPIERVKNIANEAKKYHWVGKKPPGCLPFYFVRDIHDAIQSAKGLVYIVEGEKDVLSMIAAGLSNTLTWVNGALSIPKDTPEVLQVLGVNRVIHIPDLDDTGYQSAKKLARMLRHSGVDYQALELPESLGEKGDINDLWQLCQFDSQKFQNTLKELKSLPVSQPQTPDWQQPVRRKTAHSTTTSTIEDAIKQIEDQLQVQSYKDNGFSKPVLCPFHDDHSPSAEWHQDKYVLHCFTCGETFKAKQVAEKLGIEWKVQKPAQETDNPDNQEQGERKLTHDEIGDLLRDKWKGNVAFFFGQWHCYQAGVWIPHDTLNADVWHTLKQCKPAIKPTRSIANSIKDYLEAMCAVHSSQIDKGHQYINLINGLYNLNTHQLGEHQPGLFLTSQLPFAYDKQATCETWLNYLHQVLVTPDGTPDNQLIKLVQEAFGYSLTASTRFEKMFWLHGEAATGKTTMLRILTALLGTGSLEFDFGRLKRESHQLANIAGKRVLTCSEAPAGSQIEDHLIKKIASGEKIVARRLYQESEEHQSIAKIWWAMNGLPANGDRSNAIYRRLVLIPFNRPIPAEQRNPDLINDLMNELPGIFNWAIEGLKRLDESGKFTTAQQVNQSVEEYEIENHPERAFLQDEEWIVQENNETVLASNLYLAFKEWCSRYGYSCGTRTAVGREWARLGLSKQRTSRGVEYQTIGLTKEIQSLVNRLRS